MASASEEATANIQTVAGAAEERSNSIKEIRRRVSQSTEINELATQSANLKTEVDQFLQAVRSA